MYYMPLHFFIQSGYGIGYSIISIYFIIHSGYCIICCCSLLYRAVILLYISYLSMHSCYCIICCCSVSYTVTRAISYDYMLLYFIIRSDYCIICC